MALALIALMLLAPMFGLFAILLRVGFGQRVLIAEHHVGFAGQVFTAYIFRTSLTDRIRERACDTIIATCLASSRDSKLDRLPQLLSILRGDMSFVGPRAITLNEIDYPGQFAPDYFKAKPGLVGLRLTDRPRIVDYRRRAALDRYYVRRWSIWLDLTLLATAVAAVRDDNDAK